MTGIGLASARNGVLNGGILLCSCARVEGIDNWVLQIAVVAIYSGQSLSNRGLGIATRERWPSSSSQSQ